MTLTPSNAHGVFTLPYSAGAIGSIVAGNAPTWLYLNGNILYCSITNDSRIRSYNVANGTPVQLGQVTVGANTGWMDVRGKYLFATDANAGVLRSINVSNPASPSVTTTTTVNAAWAGGGARFGLSPRGRLMLVGGPESGGNANTAYLMDVSVPATPVAVGSIATGTTHRGIVAFGPYFFALCSRDDATVKIIDCSVPSAPVLAASLTTTTDSVTAAVDVQGQYLYVGNYGNGTTTGGFEIWDISAPYAPVQCGVLAIVGGVEQMVVRGRYAYLGCRGSFATLVIDVSNPALPVLVYTLTLGAFATPGIAAGLGYIWRTSSEASGSANGLIYAASVTDNYLNRITALEEAAALRLPVSSEV